MGGIDISFDGWMVVIWGGDGLIKLWDICKFKQLLVKVEYFFIFDCYFMFNIKYLLDFLFIIVGLVLGYFYILNFGNFRLEYVIFIIFGVLFIVVDWYERFN